MQINGSEMHVEDTGGSGQAIVFSHGLLWSTKMWKFQVEALRSRFRCIAFDHRGQGQSEITRDGYDMETLTQDAAALIEKLGVAPVHFVGLSMGGFVGMRLAARRPELLRSVALVETAPDGEPALNVPKYRIMSALSAVLGFKPFTPTVMKIMFGKSFLRDPAKAALRAEMRDQLLALRIDGMRKALDGVIGRKPFNETLRVPAVVISGEEDVAVTPARSRKLLALQPGMRFVSIPKAGHTSSIENPEAITAALLEHFQGLS
jgi:pimeloyl-ACP methyl ester carboxylesterase